MRTLGARSGVVRFTQFGEQFRALPDLLETAVGGDVAGEEVLVDRERAGVDVADRVDQAHHTSGTAQVQTRQRTRPARPTERGQMKERVTCQHVVPVCDKPFIE